MDEHKKQLLYAMRILDGLYPFKSDESKSILIDFYGLTGAGFQMRENKYIKVMCRHKQSVFMKDKLV